MNRRPVIRGLSVFVVLSVLISVAALWYGPASLTLQTTLAQALIYVVATVGFYVFVGNSGVFSFGQVSFMTVGAYVGGLLAITPANKATAQPGMPAFLISAHTSPYLACLIGGLAAGVAALILSVPLIRLSGIAASLTSFAVLQVVYVVTANWGAVTNGESGLAGIPLLGNVTELWITAIAAIAIALLFQQSRWGRRLVASREDDAAARALGIGVHRERRIAFVLSAFIMGIAGAFEAELLGALVPETLYITATTQILIMLVVGGTTSLSGAVTGSLFISLVTELLRRVQAGTDFLGLNIKGPVGIQQVGLAVIMLLTLLLLPKGITASREFTFLAAPFDRLIRRRSRPQPDDPGGGYDVSESPVAKLNSPLQSISQPSILCRSCHDHRADHRGCPDWNPRHLPVEQDSAPSAPGGAGPCPCFRHSRRLRAHRAPWHRRGHPQAQSDRVLAGQQRRSLPRGHAGHPGALRRCAARRRAGSDQAPGQRLYRDRPRCPTASPQRHLGDTHRRRYQRGRPRHAARRR
jgi:branched-chain amino acid transport system permease protein